MKKKLLSIILSIAVILTSTVTVFAASSSETINSVKTYRGAGTVSGDHFDIVFDNSDGDGWIVSSGNGIKISSKNNEKITRVELTVGNGGTGDAMDHLTSSCQDGRFWTEKTPVYKTYVITLYLPETGYLTSIDIGWANGDGNVYFDAVKITYEDSETVQDVLETNNKFPSTVADAWVNELGSRLYYYESLQINGSVSLGRMAPVTPISENEYKYEGDTTWIFNMNDGVLDSIEVSGFDAATKKNGTYVPQILNEEVDFSYTEFDFNAFTSTKPTIAKGSNYNFDFSDGNYKLVLIKDNSVIAYSYDNGQNWFDSTDNPVNPNTLTYDAASIIASVLPAIGYGFSNNLVVKGNGNSFNSENYSNIVDGLMEGFSYDTSILGLKISMQFVAPEKTPNTLKVTKGGNPAKPGTDYKWRLNVDGSYDLQILTDDLIVSGTDEINNVKIEADTDVKKLTINNLILKSSRYDDFSFYCQAPETITIIVKGDNNQITNSEKHGLAMVSDGNLELTGNGNLTLAETYAEDTYVLAAENIKLDMTGDLIINGADCGVVCDDFTVTNNIGKVVIYGDNDTYGAINWYGDTNIDEDKVIITGSGTYSADETSITDEVEAVYIGSGNYSRFEAPKGTVVKSILFNTTEADYEIIQGIKAVIDANSGKDYSYFTSDAPFSKFKEVLVDGDKIDETNYSVSEGSTRVTLKASYINQLELGEHTLTIVSSDGQASTTFTIVRNPKPSPNPGYVVPNTGVE